MDYVKLANAYNTELKRFFHISEQIEYRNYLICPFCKQPVGTRKGKIRRHHFYHKNTNEIKCSATSETLLHEGAKIYIHNKLEKGESFKIVIDVKEISEPVIKDYLKALNLEELVISSNGVNLISQGKYKHYLEKSIPPFRPDVFSESENSNESLAWEIYVTHLIEEDKIDFFIKHKITFLELEPVEDGVSDYLFKVKRQYGIKFLNEFPKIGFMLFKNFQGSLFAHYKKELSNKYIRRVEQKLKKKVTANIQNFLKDDNLLFLKDQNYKLSLQIAESFSTIISPKLRGDYDQEFRYEICTDLCFEKLKELNLIKFNNKYSLDSPFYMLGKLYRFLGSLSIGEAILNYNNQIVGFLLNYPNLKTMKTTSDEILLYNEQSVSSTVIYKSVGKRSLKNNKPYLVMNNKIHVKKPLTQLMNLLKYLSNNFKLKIKIQKSNYGDQITGLKIIGLVDFNKLNDVLIENMFPVIIEKVQRYSWKHT